MSEPAKRTLKWIEVVASLEDEPDEELARVRTEADAGDTSWRRWLEEYESGAAMLLKLEVSVSIEEDGREHRLSRTNRRLWVEDHAHPPKVEQQVAELAPKDFESIAEELRGRGWDLGVRDLQEMFVRVKLDADVVARLGRERRHLGEAVDSTPGLTTFIDD